jgi:ADP-ribose pyrophosphatase
VKPHPRLPGQLAGSDLADAAVSRWRVQSSARPYATEYLTLDVDTIATPDGSAHVRAIVKPNDAIGVLAFDDEDRVLLVQQYRHSAGRRLLEIPAGVMDVAGETAEQAARRELAEETDLRARSWEVLAEAVVTPGYSTETWTLFRAWGLAAVPVADRTTREAEEADMQQWWIAFEAAVAAVLDGRISDVQTSLALLHEYARRHG